MSITCPIKAWCRSVCKRTCSSALESYWDTLPATNATCLGKDDQHFSRNTNAVATWWTVTLSSVPSHLVHAVLVMLAKSVLLTGLRHHGFSSTSHHKSQPSKPASSLGVACSSIRLCGDDPQFPAVIPSSYGTLPPGGQRCDRFGSNREASHG